MSSQSEKHQAVPKLRELSRLVRLLLPWFRQHRRDLPWRKTRDPYAIWISEIMLQQTQVKTVIPYWHRWMNALPDVNALARVSSEKLHKLWEGLGYYTRARNLQKAARMVVAEHRARFPDQFEDLMALPGVGRYTAGAISSIAFNQPQPILDGNVIRVFTRFFAIAGNPRDKAVNEWLWQLARQLVERADSAHSEPDACSHLNQALMELGALVCTPKQPRCGECPIQKHCLSLAHGTMLNYPNIPSRPVTTARRFVALVLEHRGRYLIRQRPAGIVNSHLWEFPNIEVATSARNLQATARQLAGEEVESLTPLTVINHSITRYRIALHPYRARIVSSPNPAPSNAKWLTLSQMKALPFTSAHRKIVNGLTV